MLLLLDDVMKKIASTAVNKDSAICGNSNSDDDNKKPKAITTITTEKPMATKMLQFSMPSTSIQHPKYHDYSKITIEDIKKRIIDTKNKEKSSSKSKSTITNNRPRSKTFPSSLHEMLTFIDYHPEQYYFDGYGMIRPCDIVK